MNLWLAWPLQSYNWICCAVAGAPDVQAAAGLHAGDGAVGVDVPLLVGLSVAAVDLDGRTVAGAGRVQAHVAVHGQLPAGRVRPRWLVWPLQS